MALLPRSVCDQIKKWCAEYVWNAHLGPGGFEENPHITIKFGFEDSSLHTVQAIKSILCRHGPFPIKLKGLSLFKGNEDGDVLKIDCEGSELRQLNKVMAMEFSCHGTYPKYRPHLTLCYLNPAFSGGYSLLEPPFLNQEVMIEECLWCGEDQTEYVLPLSGCDFVKAMSAFTETSGGALLRPPAQPKRRRGLKPSKVKALIYQFKMEEKKDKRGHRYCIEKGKGRVSCAVSTAKTPKKPAVKKPAKEPKEKQPRKTKATRSEMLPAKRIGVGKDAKVILEETGAEAGNHIKPSMIPPDWTDVKISDSPTADVLVTARDNKGRLKTVYSANFTMKQAAKKFARVTEMISKEEEIRDQNQANRDKPATREEADCLWLIQEQATRPGSDTDTKAKVKAYGATTLKAEHVVEGPDGSVRLQFIGKEGVAHDHLIRNPELAKMLLARKKQPADETGRLFGTDSNKLQKYTKTLDGGLFTPKDFRTLKATTLAIKLVRKLQRPKDMKEFKLRVKEVAEKVSHVLGNKPKQAIESYISPEIWSVLQPQV